MVGDLDVMKLLDSCFEQMCLSRSCMSKFSYSRQGLHQGKYSLKFLILSQLIVHTSSSKFYEILNRLNYNFMTSEVYFKKSYQELECWTSSFMVSDCILFNCANRSKKGFDCLLGCVLCFWFYSWATRLIIRQFRRALMRSVEILWSRLGFLTFFPFCYLS